MFSVQYNVLYTYSFPTLSKNLQNFFPSSKSVSTKRKIKEIMWMKMLSDVRKYLFLFTLYILHKRNVERNIGTTSYQSTF